jgi:hypothetical protein
MKDDRRDVDAHLSLDPILPAQFYDRGLISIADDGIRRLLGAVLDDAVRTFQSAQTTKALTTRQRTAIREAERWIYDASEGSPFSYGNVCEFLGIDPDAFRKGLSEWRRRYQTWGTGKKLPRRTSVRVESRLKLQRTRRRRLL